MYSSINTIFNDIIISNTLFLINLIIMKKIDFISCLFLIFVSCSNGLEIDLEKNNYGTIDSQSIVSYVYPLSDSFEKDVITRSVNSAFETNWENQNSVTLNSGNIINLPWAISSDSNMPFDIAHDIKKADGWQLLLHTFAGSSDNNVYRNYMIFYNIRTGLLKVFYYIDNIPQYNNAGVWELSMTNSHQMFNAMRDFALPIGLEDNTHWAINNMVSAPNKAFSNGWNGFQLLLTYDPNENASNRYIEISSHNLNSTEVNLFGDYNGYSTGTVISHGSELALNEIKNKKVTLTGSEAERWIKENVSISSSQGVSIYSSLNGIKDIITKGINKLFSNFSATLKGNETAYKDIQFTTNMSSTTEGTFTFNSSSPISGLRALFSEELIGGKLGVWNLSETPIIYLDPRAGHIRGDIYRMFGSSRYVYNLVINPRLIPYIVKQSTECELVAEECTDFPYSKVNVGNMGTTNEIGMNVYYDKTNHFQTKITAHYIESKYGKQLPAIFYPNEITVTEGGANKYSVSKNKLRMTLTLVTEIEGQRDTTISTRTFVPKIEWDPDLYNTFKDTDFSQFENGYMCPPSIYDYNDN